MRLKQPAAAESSEDSKKICNVLKLKYFPLDLGLLQGNDREINS